MDWWNNPTREQLEREAQAVNASYQASRHLGEEGLRDAFAAVLAWRVLNEKGVSLWVGPNPYPHLNKGAWCGQVKLITQNLHELVFGESPDAVVFAAVEFAEGQGWA